MSIEAIFKQLLLALGAIIIAMWWAASQSNKPASIAAAALAALVLILTTLKVHRSFRSSAMPAAEPGRIAGTHAAFMASTYGWGGLAMLAIYLGTTLKWQHGWQYGSGMLLIAAALIFYAANVQKPNSPFASARMLKIAKALTVAQAGAAFTALSWLIASGKLATAKNDWAANHIFMAGGLAIVFISLLAIMTSPREQQ